MLSFEERVFIDYYLSKGKTQRWIAEHLKRPFNTIWQEINRNSYGDIYDGKIAHAKFLERKSVLKPQKLTDRLKEYIESYMEKTYSFQQIEMQMVKDNFNEKVSFATMYRWFEKGYLMNGDVRYLRHKGKPYTKHVLKRYERGQSIHERSEDVEKRGRIGDYEIDTILPNRQGKKVIVTIVDRRSRYLLAGFSYNKSAQAVKETILKLLKDNPRLTLTSDNGTEFALFREIEYELEVDFYFADSYKSYQRGTNENTNGLLREFFPKGTHFEKITDEQLAEACRLINNRPCKIHKGLSRLEVFRE